MSRQKGRAPAHSNFAPTHLPNSYKHGCRPESQFDPMECRILRLAVVSVCLLDRRWTGGPRHSEQRQHRLLLDEFTKNAEHFGCLTSVLACHRGRNVGT